MIRDFCGIRRNRLVDEINALDELVDAGKAPPGVQADTVKAIDDVRKVGNIGAHMEQDVNVIVDVDPDEAQALIELIELLFEEWYVARHDRTEKIKRIAVIAAQKKEAQRPRRSAKKEEGFPLGDAVSEPAESDTPSTGSSDT
jgi:hypothetical protein